MLVFLQNRARLLKPLSGHGGVFLYLLQLYNCPIVCFFRNTSFFSFYVLMILQITSTRDSLLPYCHYYEDETETTTGCVCLRLQNLSLSRLGSIENLLWVQMLDLSHNELQSIEGKTRVSCNFVVA